MPTNNFRILLHAEYYLGDHMKMNGEEWGIWHPGEKEKVHTDFLWKNLKVRDHLENMAIDIRIVWWGGMDYTHLAQDRLVAGPCNQGLEPSWSMKRRGFSRSRRTLVFSRIPLHWVSYTSTIQLNQIHIKYMFAIQLTVLHDEGHEDYQFSLIFRAGCVHDDTLNSIPPTLHSRNNHSHFYILNLPR